MNAIDTNILLYAHDSREPAKQATAIALIESLDDGALLWQVATEYLAASRKLVPLGYNYKQAWQDIRDLRAVWHTVLPTWNVLDRVESLLTRYSLSFWDAMLIATCHEANIVRLYSEDFGAYPQIDHLEIVNPFK
ncbi:MAG: PIN domain-containing protein [Anaerolineae bacterium]|nr:PIN domain-containing protein [Anaerolineae bacterium]